MPFTGSSFVTSGTVLLAAGAIFLLLKPARKLLKLILHSLSGLIALFIINLTTSLTGVSIAINAITLLVSGLLGLPGVAALLVLKLVFKVT